MKNKDIIFNLIGNIIVYLLALIVSFVLSPYIVKEMGVATFGFIALANNFVGYFTLITVSITSMAGRFVSLEVFQKNNEKANVFFNSVFFASVALTTFLAICVGVIIFNLEKIIKIPANEIIDVKWLFVGVFLAFLLGLLFSVFSIGLFVENKIYKRSQHMVEANLVRATALFLMFFLLTPHLYYWGIMGTAYAMYILIWNIHYTRKYIPELKLNPKFFDIKAVITVISAGVWNVISQLGGVLNDGLDLIITNQIIGSAQMGILSIAKVIPNTFTQLLAQLGEPFMPKMTHAYAKNDKNELLGIINYSSKILGLLMSIPVALFIVLGGVFFRLWYPHQDANLLHVLGILSIADMIINTSSVLLFGIFTVTNKLKLNSLMTIACGAVNTMLVLIFLHTTSLGLYAVAGVSVTLSILRNLCFTFPYAARCAGLKWNVFYKAALKNMLSVGVIGIISYIALRVINPYSWLTLILTGGICIIFGLSINLFVVLNRSDRNILLRTVKKKLKIKSRA
ncbi:MAG: hypothetical protein Q8876_02970 [Bacillota bacterium]|nr:hypothetical protein [Bacillota bacterium]